MSGGSVAGEGAFSERKYVDYLGVASNPYKFSEGVSEDAEGLESWSCSCEFSEGVGEDVEGLGYGFGDSFGYYSFNG